MSEHLKLLIGSIGLVIIIAKQEWKLTLKCGNYGLQLGFHSSEVGAHVSSVPSPLSSSFPRLLHEVDPSLVFPKIVS